MFNKCPFCGKGNVIVNSFFWKYYEAPPYFCIDCGYVWYQSDVEPSNVDTSEY